MEWEEDKVTLLKYRKDNSMGGHDLPWTLVNILSTYYRLISQLCSEVNHGSKVTGHEALQRKSYAAQTLNSLGDKLNDYDGPPKDFHSKVLMPIMQRHLQAVPNYCTPPMRHTIAPRTNKPTLEDVRVFYLGDDPLNPG